MPHLETASLGVWVGAGSRDERPDEHGISHLLEHMAFKGTTRRTARQIAEEIEAVGGDLNAATSNETTAYYARVLKADVPLALDVLSDILTNPAFDPTELEREKNVIVQEIGAAEDTPDDIVFDHLQTTAFPNQPIGRSVLGTRESVCSFSADSLRAYLSRNYRGPDMVVAATGAIEHARIVAEVRAAVREVFRTGRPDAGARALCRRHLCRAAQARTGASCLRARRRRRSAIRPLFSLQVFTSVLGGGMSSRLFQEVREIRGLCYTIYDLPHALCRYRHVRALCRHRRQGRAGIDAGGHRRDRRAPPIRSTRSRSPAPRRR